MALGFNLNLGKEISGLLLCVLVVGSVLGGVSLGVYGNNRGNTCIDGSADVPIAYLSWLCAFGVTVLVWNAFTSICALFYGFGPYDLSNGCGWLLGISFVTSSLFQLAWMIVGAVSYFGQIYDSCPTGEPLYAWGIALFAIEVVMAAVGTCCACFTAYATFCDRRF